jgi:cobaltochelatase CobS
MSAHKGLEVVAYDAATETLTYRYGTGATRTLPLNMARKTTLQNLARFVGVQFQGAPSMHYTADELREVIRRGDKLAIKVAAGRPVATMPRAVAPMTAPTVAHNATGVDAIIAEVARRAAAEVLAGAKVGVDRDEVAAIVTENVTPIMAGFRGEVERMVQDMRPHVTNITLPSKQTVQVAGRQHAEFPNVLKAVSAGVHVYLVGAAGTGKSTIAENVAKALGVPFAAKSVTAQTSEASLVGFVDAHGNTVRTPFREVFENGGVFLLDEVDNGNPNVLNVLNSALANGVMAFPDGMVKRHDSFVGMASANTFGNGATAEYVGRNPIDAAFLDRFAMVAIDLDEALESSMLDAVGLDAETSRTWLTAVRTSRANVSRYGLRVIVSPRATIDGARLIKAGVDMQTAYKMRVLKGAKDEQVAKIRESVTLA